MELLDRYLDAVRANLPKDQAGDIAAEIADDLQSQADEREALIHRPLTTDECAELIKAYGHPRVVAARYAKVQYLIGPDLLPFYAHTLKIVLTIVIALELASGLIAALALGHAGYFMQSLGVAWNSAFGVIGGITLIFALIERVPAKTTVLDRIGVTKWNPRTLPIPGSVQVPRSTSFFDVLANGIFALVLLGLGGYRENIVTLVLGPAHPQLPFHLTDAWFPFYVMLLVSSAALAFSGIITFASPYLVTLRRVVMVAANSLVAVGAAFALHGGALVAPPDSTINDICVWCLYGAIAIAVSTAVWHGWMLGRGRRAQVSGGFA